MEETNRPCGLVTLAHPLENLIFSLSFFLSFFYVHLVPTGFLYQYFNWLLLTYT